MSYINKEDLLANATTWREGETWVIPVTAIRDFRTADVVAKEEYDRVCRQLGVFRVIECDTCVHNGTGYDHMPCYACEDYNKYEWRGDFPVELCADELEKPDWQAKAEELQKAYEEASITYEKKLVEVFDKIAKATKEHARGDACDWYFYGRLAEIRDECLGGK